MRDKRPVESFVVDILIRLFKLKKYQATFQTYDEFCEDKNDLMDGALHNLENIGEALRYVLDYKEYEPFVDAGWRMVVGFRNVLVHEYFGLDYSEVYDILTSELQLFEDDFFTFVDRIKTTELFQFALVDAIQELKLRKQFTIAQHLQDQYLL